METKNIIFDDGYEKITINSDPKRTIMWNPSDINFVDKFFKLIAFADTITDRVKNNFNIEDIQNFNFEEFSKEEIENSEIGKLGKTIKELGEELNKKLDETFNAKVSEVAFIGTNPLSPSSKNGQPIFINFISSIAPMIEKSFKLSDKQRADYLSKYKKGKK